METEEEGRKTEKLVFPAAGHYLISSLKSATACTGKQR